MLDQGSIHFLYVGFLLFYFIFHNITRSMKLTPLSEVLLCCLFWHGFLLIRIPTKCVKCNIPYAKEQVSFSSYLFNKTHNQNLTQEPKIHLSIKKWQLLRKPQKVFVMRYWCDIYWCIIMWKKVSWNASK